MKKIGASCSLSVKYEAFDFKTYGINLSIKK